MERTSLTLCRTPDDLNPWSEQPLHRTGGISPLEECSASRIIHRINVTIRSTLYDMRSAVTIRLDPDLEKLLDRLCKQTGRTRSELVRDALRRQLSLMRFERLRRRALPFAEARGYLTDEDVARDVS